MNRSANPPSARVSLFVFAALAAVMLVTRTHSLSQVVHLPDTDLASFFVLGFFVRRFAGFAALFALGYAIDIVVISVLGGSGFCFTPAYAMLVPAYGVMWLAGRVAAAKLGDRLAALPAMAVLLIPATFVSHLLSSGGFYFLGGRFPDPTLAGFLPRIGRYFPTTLLSTLLWSGIAAALWALAVTLRPALHAERRK
ncbi:hypothetical protein EDF56_10520 [Novosphingobium sp. PhB165]|uniref:hypothetical protein n=1 Tax=Novosphingobium sp. PhB165 TaxID=2485105 RepID=UPI00104C38B3|nr:hypothetical protein [Novosphingobium sp. PhB165]TCM17679.1 hypothetical protein EDF56_10520 [Novosphingobium sp. PhB165]